MLFCKSNKPCNILHIQLSLDILAVCVHGKFAEVKLGGDLFAAELAAHQPDDIHFAAGELEFFQEVVKEIRALIEHTGLLKLGEELLAGQYSFNRLPELGSG